MKNLFRLICLSIGTLFVCCANAAADDITNDIHCYIISLQMLSSKDQFIATSGLFAHGYWMGKLDGRTPDLDLENRVIAELPKMTGEFFTTEASRCGNELIVRGKAESLMGNDMKARGQKMLEQENTH